MHLDDLDAVMSDTGTRVVVAGHSLGGLFSALWAVRRAVEGGHRVQFRSGFRSLAEWLSALPG